MLDESFPKSPPPMVPFYASPTFSNKWDLSKTDIPIGALRQIAFFQKLRDFIPLARNAWIDQDGDGNWGQKKNDPDWIDYRQTLNTALWDNNWKHFLDSELERSEVNGRTYISRINPDADIHGSPDGNYNNNIFGRTHDIGDYEDGGRFSGIDNGWLANLNLYHGADSWNVFKKWDTANINAWNSNNNLRGIETQFMSPMSVLDARYNGSSTDTSTNLWNTINSQMTAIVNTTRTGFGGTNNSLNITDTPDPFEPSQKFDIKANYYEIANSQMWKNWDSSSTSPAYVMQSDIGLSAEDKNLRCFALAMHAWEAKTRGFKAYQDMWGRFFDLPNPNAWQRPITSLSSAGMNFASTEYSNIFKQDRELRRALGTSQRIANWYERVNPMINSTQNKRAFEDQPFAMNPFTMMTKGLHYQQLELDAWGNWGVTEGDYDNFAINKDAAGNVIHDFKRIMITGYLKHLMSKLTNSTPTRISTVTTSTQDTVTVSYSDTNSYTKDVIELYQLKLGGWEWVAQNPNYSSNYASNGKNNSETLTSTEQINFFKRKKTYTGTQTVERTGTYTRTTPISTTQTITPVDSSGNPVGSGSTTTTSITNGQPTYSPALPAGATVRPGSTGSTTITSQPVATSGTTPRFTDFDTYSTNTVLAASDNADHSLSDMANLINPTNPDGTVKAVKDLYINAQKSYNFFFDILESATGLGLRNSISPNITSTDFPDYPGVYRTSTGPASAPTTKYCVNIGPSSTGSTTVKYFGTLDEAKADANTKRKQGQFVCAKEADQLATDPTYRVYTPEVPEVTETSHSDSNGNKVIDRAHQDKIPEKGPYVVVSRPATVLQFDTIDAAKTFITKIQQQVVMLAPIVCGFEPNTAIDSTLAPYSKTWELMKEDGSPTWCLNRRLIDNQGSLESDTLINSGSPNYKLEVDSSPHSSLAKDIVTTTATGTYQITSGGPGNGTELTSLETEQMGMRGFDRTYYLPQMGFSYSGVDGAAITRTKTSLGDSSFESYIKLSRLSQEYIRGGGDTNSQMFGYIAGSGLSPTMQTLGKDGVVIVENSNAGVRFSAYPTLNTNFSDLFTVGTHPDYQENWFRAAIAYPGQRGIYIQDTVSNYRAANEINVDLHKKATKKYETELKEFEEEKEQKQILERLNAIHRKPKPKLPMARPKKKR